MGGAYQRSGLAIIKQYFVEFPKLSCYTHTMDLGVIRNIDLFKNLDSVQLAHLSNLLETVEAQKGTQLFAEGDAPDYFYIIQSGAVRISKMVSGFGEEALAVLKSGAYFGEMELIDPTVPRAAHAFVHESGSLQRLAIQAFSDLINADLELGMSVLWGVSRTLASRLRDTDDKVAAMFAMASFQ